MKNFKSKVSTLFILMLVILSTIGVCSAVAKKLYGEVIIESEHIHTYPHGSYIPFGDLDSYYDVFCSQKGTALPSDNQTEVAYWIGKVKTDPQGVSYPHLTMSDIGKEILRKSSTSGSPFEHSTYTNKTIGRYKITSTEIATPKEAYILSEMIKVEGMGELNYEQFAWWTTEAGSHGNSVSANDMSKEADAFEAYILEAAEVASTDELKHKTVEFDTLDGEHKTFENAFDFEYEPEWRTDGEYQTPTVTWDGDAWKIGPLAIDYVGSTEQFGEREEVQFAGITKMEIYTDDSATPLQLGSDWEFVWIDGERTDPDISEYPLANEKFYIKLNYRENATKITNIKTQFRYMNACGVYQDLQGTYFKATWKEKSKAYYNTWTDAEGNSHSSYDHTEYWLKLTSMKEFPSQRLALGINAARWYEYIEVDRRLDIRSGKIRIEKDVVDEDGDEVGDVNKFFYFRVNVDGAINSGSETIKVKAGSAATSKVYYWMAESGAPSYTVTEMSKDGFRQVDITNDSGTLKEDGTVKVIATNVKENQGSLKIVKKVQNKIINGKEVNLDGKTFNFTVTLNGTFKYNGVKYKNASLPITATLTVNGGVGTWNSGTIKWYGETAPTYSVSEMKSDEAEVISIIPSSGSLVAKQQVVVTAINTPAPEKAKLRIIKTLEHADMYQEDEIMKMKFNFDISVDGYETQRISITPIRKNNTFVWEYTSGYYFWEHGKNPNYTITEVDCPEGTEFASASSPDTQVSVSGTSVTGKLVSDAQKDNIVTNNIVNRPSEEHRGRIDLTKNVVEDILVDKDYKFVVTVSGKFIYKGVQYVNKTIQLTNDSSVEITNGNYDENNFVVIHVDSSKVGKWVSDEFTWYGKSAPQFVVEENTLGENVISSVEPSKGFLSDKVNGSDSVKVTAWNRDGGKSGYIHIIKTLENADKYSVDYIKELVFKFKISVDGYEPYIVSLKPQKVNNTYVWEYTSNAFTWKKDESPLKYTIEEIEIPEGAEFVSASSENGTQSGTSISGVLKESKTDSYLITTDNSFVNKLTENSGDLVIDKKVTSGSLNGKEFKFKVTLRGAFEYNGVSYGPNTGNGEELVLENVIVKGGERWSSGTIKWYGLAAPSYTVEELESDIAKPTAILNATGYMKPGANATVATFTNEAKKDQGYLQITKQIENGVTTDNEYTFKITVDGYEPYIVKIKANQTYKSDVFKWDVASGAPKYKVEEIDLPEGSSVVRIDNAEGTLSANATVNVVAINREDEKNGNFKVTKEIIADEKLLDGLALPSFDLTITISGTFEMNGESVVNSTRVINTSLQGGQTYTSPNIKWWGNNAPTVSVVENNIPTGWKNIGISNNGAEITDGLEIVVTNRLETLTIIDLTISLAGDVWEDKAQEPDSKNTEESVPNGKIDGNEEGIGGVEVYIYNGDGGLATVYDDGVEISQPIITTDNGHWEAPSLKMQKGTYDVEFVYDGQTYEPTKFLATSNGDAGAYKGASTSGRDAWANDSMALDYDRQDVNSRVQEVKGKTPIDGNGNTTGAVVGSRGEQAINYEMASSSINGNQRIASKVVTTNANGTALDVFKAKARTSTGGLTYPFDNKIHLQSYDTYISELGLVQYYMYSATYNYCLHINLGLVKREEADLAATKDLVSAKVVVNDRLLNYKFNTLDDIGKDCYSRQTYADANKIEYQLGLYKTDYYYRAEIYQANSNTAGYDKLENFYKNLGLGIDTTELEVYLTYKISLYNESPTYLAQINTVDDYFDSSFGKPIDTKVERYIQTTDGKETDELKEVANASYLTTSSGAKTGVNWNVTETGIKGSDKITYNKMQTELKDLKLASGERADIFVTFALEKTDVNGVQKAIELGTKSNVVEISNYSTFNRDGSIAGKIDRDSAPANVNIRNYNEKSWYEDDTDAAPVLELTLLSDDRSLNGKAWEDKAEDGKSVGNGLYDNDEALIGGLTTELIEKVKVKDGMTYTEYDFLWPTSKGLDALGGKTMEYLTGFDSTTETSRVASENVGVGEYGFTGVPVGNYVVRFLYGNDKTKLEDTFGITGDAVALKADGTSYSGTDKILVANYDEDKEGATGAVYNGQDYRTTLYQVGFASTDSNGYLNNEWHDLDSMSLAEAKVSDARDSESRRLEITSKSEVITNVNGTILATANDVAGNHTDLYNDYYMFADTAKMNLNIREFGSGVQKEEIQGTVLENGSVKIQEEIINYVINNIDCGLIQRPETEVVLDKEISSIKLTTNDGRVIFNASYDIDYVLRNDLFGSIDDKVVIAKIDGKYLVADVKLNEVSIGTDVMQAIDKNENKLTYIDETNGGTQNFRFINIDDTILQGTTIELNYLMTALNVGEVDMTSNMLENEISTIATNNGTKVKDEILNLANKVEEESRNSSTVDSVVKLGEYLGTTYYTGNTGSDVVVTTKVRQIVDYVDNDGIFATENNMAPDHSWKNTSVTELTGSGYEADRLLSKYITTENELIDKNGVAYITSQRNNVVLSIDTEVSDARDQLHNSGFESKLVPFVQDENAYKSQIRLTITKTVSAEDDADNLNYDNITEIVKIENSVGRRDEVAVPGNANPKLGEFEISLEERDTSATELVTFTPPTGIEAQSIISLQILIVIVAALAILAIGIVIIKKKVLR